MNDSTKDETLQINEQKFYGDAKQFWDKMPSTLDGMVGNFEIISPKDLRCSKAFLRSLIKIGKKSRGKTNRTKALDCGAGIGRITKRLLLPLFKSVDMVEMQSSFLEKAKHFIGAQVNRVDRFICSGLQDFVPAPDHYDLIWCQWVLCHLTDEDLIMFLQRCQNGLVPDGIIAIKENVSLSDETKFDSNDSSFLRSKQDYVDIILRAGLNIVKVQKQNDWPKGMYPVYMFAVK